MPRVLPPENPLNDEQKKTLLRLARRALVEAVHGRPLPEPDVTDPRLLERRGAFVTLWARGELRGCIGHFEQDFPLAETVCRMARASALYDTRFAPVRPEELDMIEIDISALTPLKVVRGPEEIVIGRDGVRVTEGPRSGTLLPQVAVENNWDVETFLTYTCRHKAGLPPDAWRKGAVIETYGADVFGEKDFPGRSADRFPGTGPS